MCTVSIIPAQIPLTMNDGGLRAIRLLCNRDEMRTRPAALAPTMKEFGGRRAVFPVDPVSGGTWIAANDAGLVFSTLNRYDAPADGVIGNASRGLVILTLLHCCSLENVLATTDRLALVDCLPYRLVVAGEREFVVLSRSNGCLQLEQRASLDEPAMFTSSGLGDEVVIKPRQDLFEQMVRQDRNQPRAQDAFHRHVWPGREEISVAMRRVDARTVNCTAVERDAESVTMTYRELEDVSAESPLVRLRLPLGRAT